ncbi:MAG: nuclease-related domain-containing protein [Chloroflexi bacterium]|nr:nuclease-related domain-containing protein [Chloroflexota bacterium]
MRVITNKKLARRNKKLTNYLFFGTFGALILGFVLINASLFTGAVPDNLTLIAQSAVLPVLLVLTVVSVRMTNMWARAPRPENAIAEGLKGLSNKSILYNYYHFPARHVLICPQGIFAIVTRWHDQEFTFREGKFYSRRNIISKFFSLIRFDGVGKPLRDAEFARQSVQRAIDEIAGDVKVQALIVFVDPSARVHFESEPETPVLYADPKTSPNLKEFMRDAKRRMTDAAADSKTKNASLMPLTDEQIEAFEEATV